MKISKESIKACLLSGAILLSQPVVQADTLGDNFSTGGTAAGLMTTGAIASSSGELAGFWISLAGTVTIVSLECKSKFVDLEKYSECVVYDSYDAAKKTVIEAVNAVIPGINELSQNSSNWTSKIGKGSTNGFGGISKDITNMSKKEKKEVVAAAQADLLNNVALGYASENPWAESLVIALKDEASNFNQPLSDTQAARILYASLQQLKESVDLL